MMINKLPGFGLRALAKLPPPNAGATYRLRSAAHNFYDKKCSCRVNITSKNLANRRAKLMAALSRTTYTEVDDGEYTTFTVQEAS